MTAEQITELARQLPAGTRVTLIEIELPTKRKDDLGAHAGRPDTAATPYPAGAILDPEGGPARLKVRDAAASYDPSGREFKEAMDGGFIPFTTKRDGKDAGAHLLAIPDIELYLEQRQAIIEFREDPPEGWPGPGGAR